MFNIKFDWKTVGLVIFVAITLLCGWKVYHNFKIVDEQKTKIVQLEQTIKSQNEFMKIQTDKLNATVEIERKYNEKIKNLQNDIIANNNVSNGLHQQLNELRTKNNTITDKAAVRQIDVISGLLETISDGYRKSAESNSRIKLEFEKCNAFIDEIYNGVE